MPVLLVGTSRGLHEFDLGEETYLRKSRVHALASNGSSWWALADGKHLWHTVDGQWKRMLAVRSESLTCILPVPQGVLVGTAEAHLLRVLDGSVEPVDSFDAVEGREKWYTPWGGPPDTRSMARAPDGTIYCNVHVGGILRSRDDGRTWQQTALDIDSDVHQVTVDPVSGTVFAAAAVGVCESRDDGDSWTISSDGLRSPYARSVAVCMDSVLVGASAGPSGGKAGIYRRDVTGGRFEPCTEGLPKSFNDNIDTFTLSARGPIAAFAGPDGNVYLSADAGRSWAPVATSIGKAECLAIR